MGGNHTMYIYNRQLTIKPDSLRAGNASAAGLISYLNQNTSLQFNLWQGLLGGPVGTVGASSRLDSYSDFTDEVARLYAEDEAYVDMVEAAGAHFVGNAEDSLWNVVHVAGEQGDVPNVCSVVRFQTEGRDFPSGVAFATEMADFFNSIHGASISVSTSTWGVPFGISVIAAYDSVAHFEASTMATQADPGFRERITGAVGIPGSNMHAVMRRVI